MPVNNLCVHHPVNPADVNPHGSLKSFHQHQCSSIFTIRSIVSCCQPENQPSYFYPTTDVDRKLNEFIEATRDRNFEWDVHSFTGPNRQVVLKELGSGRLYPIDVYLSDKIFTPCVVKEENFARCKVDQQCFHCQCGCDQLVCQCDSPEQRKYSFVHIVDYLYRRYRFKSYRSPSPYIRNKEAHA